MKMITKFSSRDRMLAALECQTADYVPCCFSAFQSLQQKAKNIRRTSKEEGAEETEGESGEE